MKNYVLIALNIFALFLCSCATTSVDTRVKIFLHPIHDEVTSFYDTRSKHVQIMDNDGNLYSTFWDVAPADYEIFAQRFADCTEKFSDKRLFSHALSIADFSLEQISPSIYVPFIKCIHAYGYNLLDKEAYAPNEYSLSFYRSHSIEGRYIPVGGNYIIGKQSVRYAEVYVDVKECEKSSLAGEEDGAIEESAETFMQVSIESYVNQMKDCLQSKSYLIRAA